MQTLTLTRPDGTPAEVPAIIVPVARASAAELAADPDGHTLAFGGAMLSDGHYHSTTIGVSGDRGPAAERGEIWLYFDVRVGTAPVVRYCVQLSELAHQINHLHHGDSCDECAGRKRPTPPLRGHRRPSRPEA